MEDIKDFCIEHVNNLTQQGREEIFNILRLYISDNDIDSSNSDGSRVFCSKIPDECFLKIYNTIKYWLEN